MPIDLHITIISQPMIVLHLNNLDQEKYLGHHTSLQLPEDPYQTDKTKNLSKSANIVIQLQMDFLVLASTSQYISFEMICWRDCSATISVNFSSFLCPKEKT